MGKKRSAGRDEDKEKEKGKAEVRRPGAATRRFMPLAVFSFGALLTVLAYVRALHAPLVFDDVIYITPSRLEGLWRHFTLHVRSVSVLSFAVNYALSGMNIALFRVTNILLHLVTSGLVFYLIHLTVHLPHVRERWGKAPMFIAPAVAVLFMLHPLQTSAVNYITQRMAIMATLFCFTGFIFYIRGVTAAGKWSLLHYILSALSFVLAIFSKENAVMVLFMLPVYDLFFLSSFQWSKFRTRCIALSVLVICLALITVSHMSVRGFVEKVITVLSHPHQPMERFSWGGKDLNWTPIEYLLTELRVVSRYILLILVPVPSLMVFDYSNAYPVSQGLFHPVSTIASLFFLLSLLYFSIRFMKRFPLISFGILWYLVTISLESFIALGLDPYFEHRNYLPSFGLFLSLASLPLYVERPRIRIKEETSLCLIALLLFSLAFMRNGVWTKGELLWKDAVEKSPRNLRALISLSSIYITEKRFQEAEDCLKRASEVRPMTTQFRLDILLNQASVYKQTNRRKEALSILKALEAENGFEEKHMGSLVPYYIGEVLREEGDFRGAKEYLEKAHNKMRRKPEVLISLGLVSRSLGERDAAEGYFRKAMELGPANGLPHLELGDMYFMENDLERAEKNYREAMAKAGGPEGWKTRALFGIAQIKMSRGEINEGKRLFQEVVTSAPDFYPPYIFLGRIYLKENNPDEALAHLGKALSFERTFMRNEPNTKLLYYYLGKAYLAKGDKKRAKENFGAFISLADADRRLKTQYAEARKEWAQIRQ